PIAENAAKPPMERDVEAVTPLTQPEASPKSPQMLRPGVHELGPTQPSLEAEVALLRVAQEALREGQPQRALQATAEHAGQFPHGALTEERRALRAIALCQAQPGAASQAQAQAFLKSSPSSPLVERVRAACGLSTASRSTFDGH